MLEQLPSATALPLGIVCGVLGLILLLSERRPKRWSEGWRELCLEVCGLVLLILAWLLLGAWALR